MRVGAPTIELDEELLGTRAAVELLVDLLTQDGPQGACDDDIDRDRGDDDEGKLGGIEKHHAEEDQREDEVEQRGQALPGQEASDRLQLPHARDRLSGRASLEIGEREVEEMMEEPAPELDVHPVGGVTERVAAKELQDRLEQAERHHAEHQDHERRHALVDQNLVDHELEKDRRRQSEQLHEQRRDQHMGERPPEAHDRRPEPAEAEAVRIRAGPAEPTGHEDRQAGRERLRLRERNLLRRSRHRINEADLALLGGDREHGEASVLQLQNGRIGNGGDAPRVHPPDDAGLELEPVCRANKILRLAEASRQSQLMA